MHIDTSLLIGTPNQVLDFYRWANNFARQEQGYMTVALSTLVDESAEDLTGLPPDHSDYALLKKLKEQELTHAVLVTQYQCDDESDIVLDTAWNMGLLNVEVDEGSEVPLHCHHGNAFVSQIPFRLRLWKPVSSTTGTATLTLPCE
jgi:hypothetical protein